MRTQIWTQQLNSDFAIIYTGVSHTFEATYLSQLVRITKINYY